MPDNMQEGSGTITSIQLDEGEVFEVFQQAQKDDAPHHGGNLRAPDSELAIHYAKEFYGRRQESMRVWAIPRASIWEISDTVHTPPLLHPLDRHGALLVAEEQTFALFGQPQPGKPLVWLEDVEDVSLQEATNVAMTQLYEGSYAGYVRFWFCPRNAILELTNLDLLQPPLDRSYRRVDGYNIREKLRTARQRVQAQQVQGEKP